MITLLKLKSFALFSCFFVLNIQTCLMQSIICSLVFFIDNIYYFNQPYYDYKPFILYRSTARAIKFIYTVQTTAFNDNIFILSDVPFDIYFNFIADIKVSSEKNLKNASVALLLGSFFFLITSIVISLLFLQYLGIYGVFALNIGALFCFLTALLCHLNFIFILHGKINIVLGK